MTYAPGWGDVWAVAQLTPVKCALSEPQTELSSCCAQAMRHGLVRWSWKPAAGPEPHPEENHQISG